MTNVTLGTFNQATPPIWGPITYLVHKFLISFFQTKKINSSNVKPPWIKMMFTFKQQNIKQNKYTYAEVIEYCIHIITQVNFKQWYIGNDR